MTKYAHSFTKAFLRSVKYSNILFRLFYCQNFPSSVLGDDNRKQIMLSKLQEVMSKTTRLKMQIFWRKFNFLTVNFNEQKKKLYVPTMDAYIEVEKTGIAPCSVLLADHFQRFSLSEIGISLLWQFIYRSYSRSNGGFLCIYCSVECPYV